MWLSQFSFHWWATECWNSVSECKGAQIIRRVYGDIKSFIDVSFNPYRVKFAATATKSHESRNLVILFISYAMSISDHHEIHFNYIRARCLSSIRGKWLRHQRGDCRMRSAEVIGFSVDLKILQRICSSFIFCFQQICWLAIKIYDQKLASDQGPVHLLAKFHSRIWVLYTRPLVVERMSVWRRRGRKFLQMARAFTNIDAISSSMFPFALIQLPR